MSAVSDTLYVSRGGGGAAWMLLPDHFPSAHRQTVTKAQACVSVKRGGGWVWGGWGVLELAAGDGYVVAIRPTPRTMGARHLGVQGLSDGANCFLIDHSPSKSHSHQPFTILFMAALWLLCVCVCVRKERETHGVSFVVS